MRRELLGNGLETVREFGQANGLIERIKTGAASSQMGTGVQYLSFAFDKTGNLMSRGDLGQGVGEVFEYDNLNRLTRSECFSSGKCTYKEYRYDAIGNLTYKSDVGTYHYDYGARPHAVAATTGVVPLSFSYDANGNATSGRQQDIRWSAFNEFRSAAKDGHRTTFFYDSEKQRFRRVDQTAQGDTTQTCYFGQIYELFENLSTGAKEDRYYVFAGGSRIAVHKEKSAGSAETRWLHRDHLDSVQAVTDENGSVVETLSYDAWGRRRNADWSSSPQALNLTAITLNRGFTDHEHIDEIGIVHANGRVMDPLIGKFLSPDPIVQAPSNPQNLNRYSYVLNNPLSYTDPSGHVVTLIAAVAVAAVIVKAAAVYGIAATLAGAIVAAGIASKVVAGVIAYAAVGAVAGAAAGAISSGSAKGAMWGALSGAVFGGIGGYFGSAVTPASVASHAIAGGTLQELQGGSFVAGFLAGGFAKFTSNAIDGLANSDGLGGELGEVLVESAAAAVVGGTASAIGGGKFENGARTGAFSYIFNRVLSSGERSNRGSLFAPVRDLYRRAVGVIEGSATGKLLVKVCAGLCVGASVTRNPDGTLSSGVVAGVGGGASVSYDPNGTSLGYAGATTSRSISGGISASAEVRAGFAGAKFGSTTAGAAVDFEGNNPLSTNQDSSSRVFKTLQPGFSASMSSQKLGFAFGLSAVVEIDSRGVLP